MHQGGSGISAFIASRVCDTDTKFLVDTGASVTILATKVYESIPLGVRPPLRQPSVTLAAYKGQLPVTGVAQIPMCIGGQGFTWEMYIAPIREEGLLGMDFLCNHRFVLAREWLELAGRRHALVTEGSPITGGA